MRFTCALTVDDAVESAVPFQPDGRPAPRSAVGWVMAVLFAALIGFLVLAPQARAQWHPRLDDDGQPIPPQNLWVAVVPSLVPALLWGAFVLAMAVYQWRQVRRGGGGRGTPGRPIQPNVWVLLALLSPLLLFEVWRLPTVAVTWYPTPAAAVTAGALPWAVVAGVGLIRIFTGVRRTARGQWANTPNAGRPATVDVTADGVRRTTEAVDVLYRWPAVVGYRETPNLLVLTLEDGQAVLLPKRAYSGGEAELRSLIQTHVAAGTFLPREARFPVVVAGG